MTNNADCTCPKAKCERHGLCDECRAYHAGQKKLKLPYCERPKVSLLGSIKKRLKI